MKSQPAVSPAAVPAHKALSVRNHPRSVPTMAPHGGGRDEPDRPFEEGVRDTIDPDLRHRLISEAAYALYARRGYVDGFETDDWLAAEGNVDHLLLNPQFASDGGAAAGAKEP
jgi:hypothetical protein